MKSRVKKIRDSTEIELGEYELIRPLKQIKGNELTGPYLILIKETKHHWTLEIGHKTCTTR